MTSSAHGAVIDLERVICRTDELGEGMARPFAVGGGAWPLKGFALRTGGAVHAYLNRCPHAGHPLDLLPGRFFTPDGLLILCSSHGAVFEKSTGLCVAGPCAGRTLTRLPLEVAGGFVMLAEGVDPAAYEDQVPP